MNGYEACDDATAELFTVCAPQERASLNKLVFFRQT